MTNPAPGVAELRAEMVRTEARYQAGKQRLAELEDQYVEHSLAPDAARRRIAELRQDIEDRLSAAALDDSVTAAITVAEGEIQRLEAEIPANERIAAALHDRVEAAKPQLVERKYERNRAARAYLMAVAVDPARAKFAEALATLRDAAVELMGAHCAAFAKFPRNGHEGDGSHAGVWGPGAIFVESLLTTSRDMWSEYPYSVRPDWLRGRVGDLPGVKEAEQRTLAMLDNDVTEIAA
jgi:hypothetical protein